MRILLALAVALLVFNSGCIQRGQEAVQPAAQVVPAPPESLGVYKGFPDYKPGMWVVYSLFGGAQVRLEVVGKETFDEREALGFELSLPAGGAITQAWFTSSGGLVKYAIKREDQVTCILQLAQVNKAALPFVDVGWTGTPPEFEGEKEYEQIQTTVKGTKVNAVKFSSAIGESWVSGEMPFGIVKEIRDGEVIREVYDYGFSGAERDISSEELRNCFEFDIMKAVPQYQ